MYRPTTSFNISEEAIATLQQLHTAEELRLYALTGGLSLCRDKTCLDQCSLALPPSVRDQLLRVPDCELIPFRVLAGTIAKIFNVIILILLFIC